MHHFQPTLLSVWFYNHVGFWIGIEVRLNQGHHPNMNHVNWIKKTYNFPHRNFQLAGIHEDDSHGLDAHIFWVGVSRQSTLNPLERCEAQLIGTSENIVVRNHTNSTQDLTQSSVSYNIFFYHWDYLPHNHNRICEIRSWSVTSTKVGALVTYYGLFLTYRSISKSKL